MIRTELILILTFFIFSEVRAQNFWEQTSGPEGGLVNCLAVNRNNILFAGFDGQWFSVSHNGQCLYRSYNEGGSWENLTGPTNKDVQSITIDTSGAVFIWVGGSGVYKSIDEGSYWSYTSYGLDGAIDGILGVFKNNYLALGQDGVYISTNGGSTWNGTNLSVTINSIFIDDEENLLTGLSQGGVYRSSDYGQSWFPSEGGLEQQIVNGFIQYNHLTFYAVSSEGVFRSSNGGYDWRLLPGSPAKVTSICMGPQGEIFIGTEEGFSYSLDEGRTWFTGNNGLVNPYITTLLSLPSGSILAGTFGDGIFITSDGGNSWNPVNQGIISTHITAFLKYKEYLFGGSQQGIIYKSSDRGDSWIRNSFDNTFTPITSFCKSKLNSFFYISSSFYLINSDKLAGEEPLHENKYKNFEYVNGIFKSDDEGNSWRKVFDNYVKVISNYFDSLSGTEYLIAAGYSGVYISTDDGETWYPSTNGIEGYIEDVGTNSLGYFYASSQDYIFRSTNFGQSWQIVYDCPSDAYHAIFDISNKDFIYAGFDWGKVVLSTDYGETWLDRGANLNVTRINSIAVDSLGNVFVGNWWGHIYESIDEGINWRNIKSGMIGGVIYNLFCDNEGNIFVGPWGGGVFRGVSSTFAPLQVTLAWPFSGLQNIMLTPELKWYPVPTVLEYRCQLSSNSSFDSLSIIMDVTLSDTSVITDSLEPGHYYYWRAAARNEYSWSIWSNASWFKTMLLTDVDDDQEPLLSYNLDQNYPNPFNPSTKISYTLKDEGNVKLFIYDIKGELISTLVNEKQQSGNYEVDFTLPGNISTGVYIYRLTVTDNSSRQVFSDVKKMVYLK